MRNFFLSVLLMMCSATICAQDYVPTEENLQSRKEFDECRFGIFIHWGIYSMLAQGEWFMHEHNINRWEYAKMADGQNGG